MKPGEYLFNQTEHIVINKPFIDRLFASAFYRTKGKYVLEVLASGDLARSCIENDESDLDLGGRWTQNLMETARSKWPLEYADYYIEVNGIKIGEGSGNLTYYRYEPERQKEDMAYKAAIPGAGIGMDIVGAINGKTLKPAENGIKLPTISTSDMIDSILGNTAFIETLTNELNSLPASDPEDQNYEEVQKNFLKERDEKENRFFNQFRKMVHLPDYLKNENLLIADLHFEGSEISPITGKISSLKLIIKNYTKYFLTRVNYKLPFGKCMCTVKSHSEYLMKYTDAILIEGLESRNDLVTIKSIPHGKKAIFVSYEVIGNLSIQPIFHTTETLVSHVIQDHMMINKTILLQEKGEKGYNKYMTLAGFVDEHVNVVDFELFQLIVTFECGKEYVLI